MSLPPEAQSIKSLINIAGILALVFGILFIIYGVITLVFIVGIVPLIFGIVDILIYMQLKDIQRLIDQRKYREAKSKTLTWMIIGFILGGVLIGILLLIAYLKYDELIRKASAAPAPPPPPV